ncbi:UbiA prenyltransferase family-domain-containing protein [Aspergillus transmontanensis]|uniref:UbiA prenyltransferase family-domain-containing protein n=1 Tax=Aspergillus transmontanensis TaxID=1034304 RepID=A0A5N6VIU6_9EURO|nr:UbiA prenyltransferase family-domain-containing protein [Aspergillus transmontanensis]
MSVSPSKHATACREQHNNQRSFLDLVFYLALTSRLNNIRILFGVFGGVISTLLAGILKAQHEPASISRQFILRQAALCFLHCFSLGAAGNTWNDLVDRDIDSKVARTKSRPLASGKVSTVEAVAWIACLYSISAGTLSWMLDDKDAWKLMMPLTAVIMLYPFGKRPAFRKLHIYPQYLLGIALGYPTIHGWSAIYGGQLTLSEILERCFPLWLFLFFWTFYGNTAYSYQDIEDDRKMKVNSAYNLAGKHIHALLAVLGIMTLLTIPFVLNPISSLWLWISWMGVWTMGITKQLISFDPSMPETGGALQLQTVVLGIWIIIACIVQLGLLELSTI